MEFNITNRFSGAVQFTAEIECEENTPTSIKVGLAVRGALKNGANLSSADLSGADLYGADLSGANLSGADLSGADLSGANLSVAYLSGANLSGADLYGADLSGANLSGADLSGANLSSADLSGADLSGADLYGANLYGANLSGADLDKGTVDTNGIIFAGNPNNWFTLGYVDQETNNINVHVGCRRFELSEGRRYWSSPDHPHVADRREVLAALDYIEAVAKLRGWNPK